MSVAVTSESRINYHNNHLPIGMSRESVEALKFANTFGNAGDSRGSALEIALTLGFAARPSLSPVRETHYRLCRPRNFNKRRGANETTIQSDMCVNAILGGRGPSRSN